MDNAINIIFSIPHYENVSLCMMKKHQLCQIRILTNLGIMYMLVNTFGSKNI